MTKTKVDDVSKKQHVVLLMFLMTALHARAQAPVAPPGERIEQEVRPAPEPVRRGIQIEAPRFPEQVPSGAESQRFTLSGVQVSGNQALSLQDLSDIWSSMVGKTISLADAFRIASSVSARYRDAGYILSQAIVPQQDLATEGATLQLRVVEGYVDRVNFVGAENLNNALAPYAQHITAERPLTLANLERNLLLMNELAGLSVRANLKPSSTAGATSMDISLTRDTKAFSVSAHNRSSRALGRLRAEASADLRGVLGNFDRHTFRFITSGSERLNYLGYSGENPIGTSGLKGTWSASVSKSEPRTPLPNIDSDTANVAVGLSYPVIRSRAMNLDVRGHIGGSNNDSNNPFPSKDNLRVLRAGATFDSLDTVGGLNLADVEIAKGFSGLGASRRGDPLLSRNGLADPQFAKLTYYLARLQSITGPWSVLLALSGQHSNDVLATSETFGLGGDLFVRAFDPSEVIGDKGIAGKVELRYDLPMPNVRSTLYAYHDAGRVSYNTAASPSTTIKATGIGARFSITQGIRGYLEASKPHNRIPGSSGNSNVRFFSGIGIDF